MGYMKLYQAHFVKQVYGGADERYGPGAAPVTGQFAAPQYGAAPGSQTRGPGGAPGAPGSQV